MILKNCTLFDGNDFHKQPADIRIKGDKIEYIGKIKDSTDNKVFDLKRDIVVPGYVDIHTHGIHGMDFSSDTDIDYNDFFDYYIKKGTQSVFPTTVTMSIDDINELLERADSITHPAFCGIHLEGPFISKNKAGAHKRNLVLDATLDNFKKINAEHMHLIKRATIACELDKDFALADYLKSLNIVLSFGHTQCDAQSGYDAFDKGYLLSTHHFNAMEQMHHRKVYITGAALIDERVSVEYIPDLFHICKDMLKILFKLKDQDKLIMVTDSIAAACMPDGDYKLGQLEVKVENGIVTDRFGTIAGSSVTMDDGVCNMVNAGFSPVTVLKSATSNPAKLMNLKDAGFLKKGVTANINILDDSYRLKNVINNGKFIV